MGYVINFAPWTRKYLTRLAASIRALETSPNIANVLRQLEEADRFLHNVLLIEATAKLVLEGFRAAFEPTLPPANFQKQPDAKLVSPETQEEIFLEVSILGRARESIEAFEAMNAVTITFMKMPAGVRWAGRLYKIPAPSHLADVVSRIEKALKRTFSPEFLNRVDDVVVFNSLTKDHIFEIIDILMKGVHKRLVNLGFTLQITPEAKEFIADKGYDSQFGARPLHRAIQKYLEDPLAEEILNLNVKQGDVLIAGLDKENGKITFEFGKKEEEANV